MVNTVWEREETSFCSVAAVARRVAPPESNAAASAALPTSMYVRLRTDVAPVASSTMSRFSAARSSRTRRVEALGGRGGFPLEGLLCGPLEGQLGAPGALCFEPSARAPSSCCLFVALGLVPCCVACADHYSAFQIAQVVEKSSKVADSGRTSFLEAGDGLSKVTNLLLIDFYEADMH